MKQGNNISKGDQRICLPMHSYLCMYTLVVFPPLFFYLFITLTLLVCFGFPLLLWFLFFTQFGAPLSFLSLFFVIRCFLVLSVMFYGCFFLCEFFISVFSFLLLAFPLLLCQLVSHLSFILFPKQYLVLSYIVY